MSGPYAHLDVQDASALHRAFHHARDSPACANNSPRFIGADAEDFCSTSIRCDAVASGLHPFWEEAIVGDPILEVIGV